MTRAELLNRLCGLFPDPAYLEIGVYQGETFLAVQAARKVGVDPNFAFDIDAAMRDQPHATLLRLPSDEFFAAPPQGGFDVVFLDGLHTAEQTLRDLLNAIPLLRPGGIVVLDDMVPSSYHASLPSATASIRLREAMGDRDQSWMGDVYKLAFFIESFLQPFSLATVGGQTLVWRATRPAAQMTRRTLEQVARTPFEATRAERQVFNPVSLDEAIRQMGRSA